MEIISKRTVGLTVEERSARSFFELLLDRGIGIPAAAARAEEVHPGLDPAFYRFLRGEPVMPAG